MKALFLSTILLGSFLLFQIQPLIGKIITPFFGGSAAVWTSCMFFFQTFLLVGYLYSHAITKLTISKQATIHCTLTLCCLLFLPISVELFHLTASNESPITDILATLFFAIGIPYLLLSTSVPMLQKWDSLLNQKESSTNYYFYAFSNVGALLGLLSYPFIFEPQLSISTQKTIWSISFLSYSAFVLYISFLVIKRSKGVQLADSEKKSKTSLPLLKQLYWLALSSTGVILLLTITNATTQNIPPVPFLWVLPLVIYLATYIFSFSRKNFYHRWMTASFFVLSSICTAILYHTNAIFDIYTQLVIYSITLATGCMICHGELAKSSPKEEHLTKYYLNISLGGFLGGLFVSVISPIAFNEFLEFPIGILLTMSLLLMGSIRTSYQESLFSIIRAKQLALFFGIVSFVGMFSYLNTSYKKFDVLTSRNFYGTLSVKDIEVEGIKERRLVDGMTSHGAQSLDPEIKHLPIAYFSHKSGIGIVLTELKKSANLNMGVIGLGTGTLSAYGEQGDNIEFFELNPNVVRVAKNYFTYLSDSKANITITLGDGRLSLTKRPEDSPLFNVLVIDAFSSDTIPKHLLTLESFQLYWQNLSKDGVLALHISNNYIDLLPVVKAAASKMGMQLMYFSQSNSAEDGTSADWMIMTNNQSLISNRVLANKSNDKSIEKAKEIIWTDSFSSLLHVVK